VWQTTDFKSNDFGCVAKKGLRERFFGCVARIGVIAKKWGFRALSPSARMENKMEGGGHAIPGILQSVRRRLISKELEETVVFKCEASVRKE
jgi:hypothetical protein